MAHRLWAPTVVPVPKGDSQIWLEIDQYLTGQNLRNACKVGRWKEILEESSRKFVTKNTQNDLYYFTSYLLGKPKAGREVAELCSSIISMSNGCMHAPCCRDRLQRWFTTNPHVFLIKSCVWSNLCPLGLDLAFYLTKISNVLSIHHTTYFREICGHSYLPWEIFKCLSVLIVTRNHFPLLMNYRVPYSFKFFQ